MSQLVLAVLMTVATQGQQPGRTADNQSSRQGGASAAMLDGQWTVVYAEKQGQRMDSAAKSNVTIRGNVLTCTFDGQQHTLRLTLGPNQTVTAFEEGQLGRAGTGTSGARNNTGAGGLGNVAGINEQGTQHGVYIFSNEYLCFSLDAGRGTTGTGTGTTGTDRTGTGRTGTGGTTGTATGGPGSAIGAAAGQPHKGSFVLILQRHGGTTGR